MLLNAIKLGTAVGKAEDIVSMHVCIAQNWWRSEQAALRRRGYYHPDLFYSTGTRYPTKPLNISVS